jgi:hypothetical protein
MEPTTLSYAVAVVCLGPILRSKISTSKRKQVAQHLSERKPIKEHSFGDRLETRPEIILRGPALNLQSSKPGATHQIP